MPPAPGLPSVFWSRNLLSTLPIVSIFKLIYISDPVFKQVSLTFENWLVSMKLFFLFSKGLSYKTKGLGWSLVVGLPQSMCTVLGSALAPNTQNNKTNLKIFWMQELGFFFKIVFHFHMHFKSLAVFKKGRSLMKRKEFLNDWLSLLARVAGITTFS